MMYSCALWGNEEGGANGDLGYAHRPVSTDITSDALETAQARKIAHVLSALHLQPGARVLEFGTGWGALAIAAARDYDAQVDTLTLSVEQKTLAESRIREAGLEGRIRVYLMDYRSIPQDWNGCFDAFVSVEMIEHVGPQYYEQYFSIINRALKSSSATAVITGSTFPEKRYTTRQYAHYLSYTYSC
jgi:cyclopropane-fatty-acyl-phospholipid synthase